MMMNTKAPHHQTGHSPAFALDRPDQAEKLPITTLGYFEHRENDRVQEGGHARSPWLSSVDRIVLFRLIDRSAIMSCDK